MFFIAQQVAALIKLLHSENSERQIAFAIALSFAAGLSPMWSLQALVIYLIVLVFRIQIGAFLLFWFIFTLFSLAFAPFFNAIGAAILNISFFEGLFIAMQKSDVLSFSRFNNTVVMGGFVVGLSAFPLIYLLSHFFIVKYRESFLTYIKSTKYYVVFKSTILVKLYGFYKKYNAL